MPKINLAQEAFRNELTARRRRMVYWLSILVLLLVLGAYGGVFLLASGVQADRDDVERDIAALQSQLNDRKEDVKQIIAFRNRLKILRSALSTHVQWTNLLSELERLVTPQAVFQGLEGTVRDKVIKASVAVPSIDAAADLVASLQNKMAVNETPFTNVTPVSLAAVEQQSAVSGSTPTIIGYSMVLGFLASQDAFLVPKDSPVVPLPAVPAASSSSPAPAAPEV